MSKPPDWWLKQREPRFGCADVTIVAIAAIVAFVILILILSRGDLSTILERIPFGNSATATPAPPTTVVTNTRGGVVTSDDTATALANSVITPIAVPPTQSPTLDPTATPAFKVASIKTACDIHRGDKPSVGTPSFPSQVGWRVDLDGKQANADNASWFEVIVDDPNAGQYNNNKGWIVDNCVNTAP